VTDCPTGWQRNETWGWDAWELNLARLHKTMGTNMVPGELVDFEIP